jgi:hypothetical protein
MIQWIFEHLGIVIFLVIFLTQILRAVLRARKTASEHQGQRDDSAETRRMQEVQERIRRQIAERRGQHAPAEIPPPPPPPPAAELPVPRPQTTQLPDPFGGALGRMLEELQRRAQPQSLPPPPPPPMVAHRNVAEVERQQQLAEQMKSLEDARALAQRRAAHLVADKYAEAQTEGALRTDAREKLLQDLSDPQSLRRAFVLREILGTPVGMR